MNRRWLTVIGALFTVVSLYFAFRGIHYREILDALANVDYGWTVAIVVVTILSIWLRALRWKLMLEPIKPVSLRHAYSATMIGFMANNVLPMRLGEVVRAYSIGRSAGVSKSAAFATIVVERAFDLMALLLFLGILLPRFTFAPWLQSLGYIALAMCLLMFVVMALVRWKRGLAVRVIAWFTKFLPHGLQERVEEVFHRFLDGFEVLSKGNHILMVFLLSILVWFTVSFTFYFTIVTFRLNVHDPPLGITASFVLMVVCALGVMLPSGPGFVGTFEFAAKYGLMIFKVSEEVALSWALFYHAVQFIPITILGFYHLWRENFSLARAVEGEPEP